MEYNLIRNAYFTSLTTSGTGNMSLLWAQLELLMDENTTSSGVDVASSGVLFLEVDLSQRVKVDEIRLYANDLSKSANINFYYKDTTSGSYTLLATSSGAYYYTTIPDPSAPRYIRATISGIAITLYEFEVTNDDYIVAFGEDGTQYAEYLGDTPIGEEGTPQAVAIYNNGTSAIPADAYTCIDYTGEVADEYVKISATENGVYCGIYDGILMEDDDEDSTYRWSQGAFYHTATSGNDVVVSSGTDGTYTTPVFMLDEGNNSSYFIVDGTAVSGAGSISYDDDSYNGTIRVRSSSTAPVTVNEVFICRKDTVAASFYLDRWQIYPNTTNLKYMYVGAGTYNNDQGSRCFIDKHTGYVAATYMTYGGFPANYYPILALVSRNGVSQYSKAAGAGEYRYYFHFCDFDNDIGIWGYNQTNVNGYKLYHINKLGTLTATISDGTDFLYDLATEWDGLGVWYTDKLSDLVKHLDDDGTLLHSVALPQPRAICATLDNGCWVIDNTNTSAYRYTSSGTLSQTVSLGNLATRMTHDYNDGFWYLYNNHVYHVTSGGVSDVDVAFAGVTRVVPTRNGCVIYNAATGVAKFVDYSSKAITKTWATGYTNLTVGVMSSTIDGLCINGSYFPASYDPVWGDGINWQEVRKDGYYLPKCKYHQVETTLRGNAALKKIIMSPAVKVQDIASKTYKNMYIKTDIPNDADISNYEAVLKTWWSVDN